MPLFLRTDIESLLGGKLGCDVGIVLDKVFFLPTVSHNEEVCICHGKLLLQFSLFQAGIEHDDHCPNLLQCKEGKNGIGRSVRPEGNMPARSQAQGKQSCRQLIGGLFHILIAPGVILVAQGGTS